MHIYQFDFLHYRYPLPIHLEALVVVRITDSVTVTTRFEYPGLDPVLVPAPIRLVFPLLIPALFNLDDISNSS